MSMLAHAKYHLTRPREMIDWINHSYHRLYVKNRVDIQLSNLCRNSRVKTNNLTRGTFRKLGRNAYRRVFSSKSKLYLNPKRVTIERVLRGVV